jgi:hypothetical protein
MKPPRRKPLANRAEDFVYRHKLSADPSALFGITDPVSAVAVLIDGVEDDTRRRALRRNWQRIIDTATPPSGTRREGDPHR